MRISYLQSKVGNFRDSYEARDGETDAAKSQWNGILNRQRSMTDRDAVFIESLFPSFSAFLAPMSDAYNGNYKALKHSIAASMRVLNWYDEQIPKQNAPKTREQIQGLLFFGYLFNAFALATAGYKDSAVKAANVALEHCRKAPSAKIDKSRKYGGGPIASVLANAIEALSILVSER